MAVKEGLPATDFSRMNREYIRNVAEGETVKDGLPATDFSRMNREYIKAVVEEAGGGGGNSDLSVAEMTIIGEYNNILSVVSEEVGSESIMTASNTYTGTVKIPLYKGHYVLVLDIPYFSSVSVTGNAEVIMEGFGIHITGNCTITRE